MIFSFPVLTMTCMSLVIFPAVLVIVIADEPCLEPYNTITAISAMNLPEDERNRDPCYINWKNEEKNKYDKILRDREALERRILENSRPRPYDNSQDTYRKQEESRQRIEDDRNRVTKPKPESSNSKYIVVICIGLIVSVSFISGCYGVYRRGKQPAPTRTQGPAQVTTTTAELDPLMSNDAMRQQPHSSPRPAPVTRRPGAIMPESQEEPPIVNIKTAIYDTDDNPPSYAEAIAMPTAPPQEESPENSTI